MLKALRHHPLLVGTAEVLVDAARYVAIVLLVLLLVAQLAKLGL
jgi:general stress protein CsbA